MKVCVFIVTDGRFPLFKDCCLSVEKHLPADARVRIIVNGPQPATEAWLSQFAHPAYSWQRVPKQSRSLARNLAFADTESEILYFLDDDVVVAQDIFTAAIIQFSKNSHLGILGGPNLTLPHSQPGEKLFGAIMTSGFAAPLVHRRYGSKSQDLQAATEHSLILCNLALRLSAIPSWLRFKNDMRSNEENLFLYHCRKLEIECRLSQELAVYHRRRSTLGSFGQQIHSYGFGRAQQTWAAPKSCHLAFIVPALFCLIFFTALTKPVFWGGLLVLIIIHSLLSFAGAWRSKQMRLLGLKPLFWAIPLTLAIHLSYGLGFWRGLAYCAYRRART